MADNDPFKVDPSEKWVLENGGMASSADLAASKKRNVNPPRGVFGAFPGATPKYATNNGDAHDYRESMARMFLKVNNYTKLLDAFKNSDALPVATVLAGDDPSSISGGGGGYIDFLLQNVQHSFQEKMQVMEVLADEHVAYVFGQGAPTWTYSGSLINTKQDDQAMNMLRLYRDMGRGTKLAQRNTLISLRYDGLFVSGVMCNLSWNLSSEMETVVPFSFNLLVKQYQLRPNTFSGLVQLTTPFAVQTSGYQPFETGAASYSTQPVRATLTPSAPQTPGEVADAATAAKLALRLDTTVNAGLTASKQKLDAAGTP